MLLAAARLAHATLAKCGSKARSTSCRIATLCISGSVLDARRLQRAMLPNYCGPLPQRGCKRPPSATAITTTISSGFGASGIDTVIVSKWSNDQDSSLWLSGRSRLAPQAATLTLDGMTALPPPTAVRIGFPSMGEYRRRHALLAIEADNRALAVGNRRVRQQLDQ